MIRVCITSCKNVRKYECTMKCSKTITKYRITFKWMSHVIIFSFDIWKASVISCRAENAIDKRKMDRLAKGTPINQRQFIDNETVLSL